MDEKEMIGMSEASILHQEINKVFSLPLKYQKSIAMLIEQYCAMASASQTNGTKKLGIADGKYALPEDIDTIT